MIAQKLLDYASYLGLRHASLYRVRAYRRAAMTILGLDRPVEEIVAAEGRKGLEALPGIGRHLSATLDGLATTGEFRTLDVKHYHQQDHRKRRPGGQPGFPFAKALSDAGACG
jgi:DNA polymerase/3'-5' exonuclease PolX